MSILSTLGRLTADYRAARAERRTRMLIGSLPYEIQKDIGWPDTYPSRHAASSGAGHWAGAR